MKGMTQSVLSPVNDLDLSSLECLEALFTGTVPYSFALLKSLFTIFPVESQMICSSLYSRSLEQHRAVEGRGAQPLNGVDTSPVVGKPLRWLVFMKF